MLLTHDVAKAVARRGGFAELVSRGIDGPITITIQFRGRDGRLATYLLAVARKKGRVVVSRELLRYRRGQHGKPWRFLDFTDGEGQAITNESLYGREGASAERENFSLEEP